MIGSDTVPVVYFDNAGSPIPTKKLLQNIFDELIQNGSLNQLSNPHSGSSNINSIRTIQVRIFY